MIAVVDYGVNNLKSVVRALAAAGHQSILTSDPDEVRTALHNLSAEAIPVAIGFHPYFQVNDAPRDEWTFGLAAQKEWLLAPDKIPTGETRPIEQICGHRLLLRSHLIPGEWFESIANQSEIGSSWGLRPNHRPADPRGAGDPLALPGPSDGVAHPRLPVRPVRLPPVRLERPHRAPDQVNADGGLEDGRKVDRLHDLALEGVDVDLVPCDGGPRGLRLLLGSLWLLLRGPLRARGLLRLRSGGRRDGDLGCLGVRGFRFGGGRWLLEFPLRRPHTPCLDSFEMYVSSGAFSSFTKPAREASRSRINRFVGPGIEPWTRRYCVRTFP